MEIARRQTNGVTLATQHRHAKTMYPYSVVLQQTKTHGVNEVDGCPPRSAAEEQAPCSPLLIGQYPAIGHTLMSLRHRQNPPSSLASFSSTYQQHTNKLPHHTPITTTLGEYISQCTAPFPAASPTHPTRICEISNLNRLSRLDHHQYCDTKASSMASTRACSLPYPHTRSS